MESYDWSLCIFALVFCLLILSCAYFCFVKRAKNKKEELYISKSKRARSRDDINLNFILKKDYKATQLSKV